VAKEYYNPVVASTLEAGTKAALRGLGVAGKVMAGVLVGIGRGLAPVADSVGEAAEKAWEEKVKPKVQQGLGKLRD